MIENKMPGIAEPILSNLFTIPLLQVNISEDTSELSGNTDFIPSTKQENTYPPIGHYRVLERYPNTKNILLKNIRFALKKLGYATEFDISTSWFTKNNKGDSAPMHHHKNSWFSVIYYYENYDNNSGKFIVYNPLNNLTSFDDKIIDVNKFNTPMAVIAPERKKMVILPSYLYHSIDEHKSELTRYSLAINIVPVGFYGKENDSVYDTSWYSVKNQFTTWKK